MKQAIEWKNSDSKFSIEEWSSLSKSEFTGGEMSRHFLIVGETGSGKTKSAILPLTKSILNHETQPSMLVVDPKNEIYQYISRYPKILKFDSEKMGHRINFFEGVDMSTASADYFLSKLISVQPTNIRGGTDPYWSNMGTACLKAFLNIDLELYKRNSLISFWRDFGSFLYGYALELPDTQFNNQETKTKSINATQELLNFFQSSFDLEQHLINYSKLLSSPFHLMPLSAFISSEYTWLETNESKVFLDSLIRTGLSAEQTFACIISVVSSIIVPFTSKEFRQAISINPFYRKENKCMSTLDMMDMGVRLVYSPQSGSETDDLIARCVKATFFDLSFKRKNLERPFAYICDEFQRFISSDKQSGEQSFLDRCRAYRVSCILATQSIDSLRYSLSSSAKGETNANYESINVLLNNTGNKLFFRNTDIKTTENLSKLIPAPRNPYDLHVITVRPPSTLTVGECYYLFSDGTWGRGKMKFNHADWKVDLAAEQGEVPLFDFPFRLSNDDTATELPFCD